MNKRLNFVCLCLAAAAAGFASEEDRIITFDVPGATATSPVGILPNGKIVGTWFDSKGGHGFIRGKNGKFTDFDVQGAVSTSVNSFNAQGDIVGTYTDTNQASHGYVRSAGGAIITFDLPAAGQSKGQGTFAANINSSGTIAGYYIDSNKVAHGYVGTPGDFTTFDAPLAMSTFTASVDALNPEGDIVGGFPDANGVNHGYVRTADGELKQIDGPGQPSTYLTGINPVGLISGTYIDENGGHGLLCNRAGDITTFDYPGAINTYPANLSAWGEVTGVWVSPGGGAHGFIGVPGNLQSFDVRGAGTGQRQGTIPVYNDDSGRVVGFFIDGNNVMHGFLRREE